jgi:hypothetical protein
MMREGREGGKMSVGTVSVKMSTKNGGVKKEHEIFEDAKKRERDTTITQVEAMSLPTSKILLLLGCPCSSCGGGGREDGGRGRRSTCPAGAAATSGGGGGREGGRGGREGGRGGGREGGICMSM